MARLESQVRVLDNALMTDGSFASIKIIDGRISDIRAVGSSSGGADVIDLDGQLLLPGFIEGHIHLDKCFIGDEWHSYRRGNSIADRIRIEREELAMARPVVERARALVERCIANGTSFIRTHVDIDPDIGLRHFEAILQIRDEFREAVDIQIVAFPQHGLLVKPGSLKLMEEAIERGADLVGGLDPATFDGDIDEHLDAIFGLAERKAVGLDIHLHDWGDLGAFEIELIAARTRALGMVGKVAISHAYALGAIDAEALDRVAALLAEAGVSIMTNAPGDHAFPPVLHLRAAGVNVFAGSDNVRDCWWPYGDADMLGRAMMIGYRSGFYADDELEVAFDLVTGAGATAVGVSEYGIEVGVPANLVVIPARHVPEAVVTYPPRSLVLHRGRVVARDGHFAPE
jgi:cytosine deaminase